MLDEDKQRQVTILIITGIVIVSIVTICILISIWMPKSSEENEDKFEVGKVKFDTISTDDVVKKYYSEIFALMLNKDYDALYKKLNKDYIAYSKMTVTKLKDKLENANVSGTLLELNQYNNGAYENNYVYTLNLKAKESTNDITLTVIEESPNNYTICFDDFVGYKENAYDNTIDSINIKVDEVTYYSSNVTYNITLKNMHNNNIIINSEKLYEGIYLLDSSGNIIQPSNVVFAGRTIEIIPNGTKSLEISFNIDSLNFYSISGFVVRGVKYLGINKLSDVTFKF